MFYRQRSIPTAQQQALFADTESRIMAIVALAASQLETRRFAERWTGEGLDLDLVDPEALRAEWLSSAPDVHSLIPIQAAWLAAERAGARP